jgi:hypothetical protein
VSDLVICRHCARPMLDPSEQYYPVACHCPFCDWCGAHGPEVETVTLDEDTVCRACRAAETC